MYSTRNKRSIRSIKREKFKPEPYQKGGINWIVDHTNSALFWDPGLGKTATLLHAFKKIKATGEVDSMLLVATKRIANKVWGDEVTKWNLPFTCSKILGTPKQRFEAMAAEADIYLTNYENLEWLFKNLEHNNFGNCMLGCDEITKLKHTNTSRFKAIKKHLKKFKRRVGLTGTPIPNGMEDLFGQIYVLDQGEALGQWITQYRNRYFHPTGYGGYKWVLNKGCEEEIYEAIGGLVHRAGADLLELPPLIVVDRKVRLDDKAWKQYAEMELEYMMLAAEGGTINAVNAASANSKLRQIANGRVYGSTEEEDILDIISNQTREVFHIHDEKTTDLLSLLEEMQGYPAFVAYEFTHDRMAITEALLKSNSVSVNLPENANGKKFVPFIGGGTSDKDADEYIDRWNAGDLGPILLGHPASVAHGLNLQGTHAFVVYFALSHNLELYEQFYKRVYRKGQKGTVYLYRILAEDTVDEDMVTVLALKDASQQALLSAMLERTQQR